MTPGRSNRGALGGKNLSYVLLFNPEGTAYASTTKFRDLAELQNRRRLHMGDHPDPQAH